MLRRFADARLRRRLARALRATKAARERASTAEQLLAIRDREIGTLRVLEATWQRIARQAQHDLTTARQETHQ